MSKPELPLSRDEIDMIATFAQSPVYGAVAKMFRLARGAEVEALIACKDEGFRKIQGRIEGIDIVLNLPNAHVEISRRLKEIEEAKEKHDKQTKVRARALRRPGQ